MDVAERAMPAVAGAKSVQDYIDELPGWADGTRLKSAPMTGMQWRIWSLAAAGKFFEGFVVFMTGVALPLIVARVPHPLGARTASSAPPASPASCSARSCWAACPTISAASACSSPR